ncbi:hypothetical protein L916_12820 [Phytophthora nicotianae]|uniref:RXLR phytopathogen effector protein WY-domain domain-containing protein n=1 Tax=Phytophthora nicotianae TaxID=4792 RepID=W2ILN2_PHYNI|nr:hypothetical protein L916_12820 [Phytophthora nicotianae]
MDGTRNVANSVEDDVLRFWVKSGKTPDKTLVDLRLDKMTSMDHPMWNTWAKYTVIYIESYPNKAIDQVATLTQRFGDEQVAMIIVVLKTEGRMEELATKLQAAQFNIWLDHRESVQNILVKLRLSRTDLHAYHNPLFDTLVSYMPLSSQTIQKKYIDAVQCIKAGLQK